MIDRDVVRDAVRSSLDDEMAELFDELITRIEGERDISEDFHGEVRSVLEPCLPNGHNAFVDDDAREVAGRMLRYQETLREIAEHKVDYEGLEFTMEALHIAQAYVKTIKLARAALEEGEG